MADNVEDEQWQGGANGEPITILTRMPPGQPQAIKPHKIEDHVARAVRRTYDKLTEEEQQYYEKLFEDQPIIEDKTALQFLLQNNEPQSGISSPLTFLPKQKQIKWQSSTVVTVLTKAAANANPQPAALDISEDEDDDYDAPIIMQASTETAWTAKQFRGLTTANFGRSQRLRTAQNYAEIVNNDNLFE